jgi:hypothetical protein
MKFTSEKEKQIFTIINDGGRATFATIVAKVEQKMYKRGNPLAAYKIEKRVNYQLSLNCVYQNAVNKQREREGLEKDFVASSNWHEKVYDGVNGAILRHKEHHDKKYLSGIVKNAEVVDYFVDGERATPEQVEIIKQFRQVSKAPQNQGIEQAVIFRAISLENIEEIRTNGEVLTF